MSRRRLRGRSEKVRRRAQREARALRSPAEVIREATSVERLAYTRTQAAAALGISRSTFNRRVLRLVETVELPWAPDSFPVDEVKRMLAERRQRARGGPRPAPPGRPAAVPSEVAERIRSDRRAGKSLAQIARELNATATPTAHRGAQWWPSTVRALLQRTQAS